MGRSVCLIDWGNGERMKWTKTAVVVMVLLCSSVVTSLAYGDSFEDWFGAAPNDYIKTRSYIGVVGISTFIDQGGDFNGLNSVQFGPVTYSTSPVTQFTNPEVDLVPAINRNFGFGILMGERVGPWAGEISYWRSTHTATYTGGGVLFTTPATMESLNFDLKRYFLTQLPTQPFFSLGISFPWITIVNGSDVLNYQSAPNPDGTYNVVNINNETISGIGFEMGVGLEIYLGNGFSLVGSAEQRWTGFNQVNGAEKVGVGEIYYDGDPNETLPAQGSATTGPNNIGNFEGDGLNFYVGTTVGFE